jgi:large subunit ribosomal protein L4e
MKVSIIDTKNATVGQVELPKQFSEPVRTDLITRAVLTVQANKRQPYGASPLAGMRHVTELSRRRRDYKTSYGKGISRVPRKIHSRNGVQMNWVAAFAPGTRGGKNAHPPKASKVWDLKLNDAERKKAIRSALAATVSKELVAARGHKVPAQYPFVLSDEFAAVSKTKDLFTVLAAAGFSEEFTRSSEKTLRSGKGKMRGRKYKLRKGPLLVVADACELQQAGRNIPGLEVVRLTDLNAELLAPGAVAGRATLFTKAAIEKLASTNLFM